MFEIRPFTQDKQPYVGWKITYNLRDRGCFDVAIVYGPKNWAEALLPEVQRLYWETYESPNNILSNK